MTTQYTITSGSFLFDYYILPSLGGPQFTGVSSPADVASFLSSGVSDVNTIQSIGFNAIEILSNSSDGLAAVGTTVGVYGRYVPVLGYGLAAVELAARASEGDYAAATIAGIANTSGIYVGVSSADAIAASRGGILIGSFIADGVALEGAAGIVGVGGGFSSWVGATLAVGAALKFEYNTFTGEIGNHDPGQLIPVPSTDGNCYATAMNLPFGYSHRRKPSRWRTEARSKARAALAGPCSNPQFATKKSACTYRRLLPWA